MSTVDLPPAIQSLAQGRLGHSMQRQGDAIDTYMDDAHRDFLLQRGKVSYANATAIRRVSESGSGRVRILDAGT